MSLVLGLGLERSCPWPREVLSSKRLSLALALASDFFCVLGLGLGLEPCVLDSTSGNYNIDLMQINGNQNFRKYVNNILTTSTKCAIDFPTRITDHSKTLLDHIYVNDPKHSYTSGVLLCDLSDHMATFVSISTKKSRVISKDQFLIRDMKNFNLEKILRALENDLTAANLNSIDSAQDAFDKFEKVLHIVVNKFAPLKKASRKETKLSQKPWLSRELLNLIKQKNKLFKQLHKKFDEDIFQKYKKQRNALNRVIKRVKEN